MTHPLGMRSIPAMIRDGNKNIDNPDITYETSYDRNVMMTKMSSEDLSAPSRTYKRDKSGGNLMYHVQLYKASSAKIIRALCHLYRKSARRNELRRIEETHESRKFKYDSLDYAHHISGLLKG